jgi:hypothetical protein
MQEELATVKGPQRIEEYSRRGRTRKQYREL